jgi:hypothetical protein
MQEIRTVQQAQFTEDYPKLTRRQLEEKYHMGWSALRKKASRLGIRRNIETFTSSPEYIEKISGLMADIPSFESLIDLSVREANLVGSQIFTPNIVEAEIATDKPIALCFTADWHLGGLGVDYVQFSDDMNTIEKTDGLYVQIGGDLRDNFIQPSKIGGALESQPIVRQTMLLKQAINKIKDKITGIGMGNHDWDKDMTGVNFIAELARTFKIIYTDVGGLFRLRVGNVNYNIFRSHKFKGHSNLNMNSVCKNAFRTGEFDADIYVIEHMHYATFEPFTGHGEDKLALRTGTYKTKDSFARAHGFYGLKVANPTVILFPNTKKMIPFLQLNDAVNHLQYLRNKI